MIYKGETSWLIAGLPLPLYKPSFVMGNGDWYLFWPMASYSFYEAQGQGGYLYYPHESKTSEITFSRNNKQAT